MRVIALLMTVSLAGLPSPAGAEGASVSVSPRFATEGSTVLITVRVDPDPSLRALLVEADSPRLFRSSLVQLDGARSARVHTLRLRSLPPGHYAVRVVIDHAEADEDAPPDATLHAKFRIVS